MSKSKSRNIGKWVLIVVAAVIVWYALWFGAQKALGDTTTTCNSEGQCVKAELVNGDATGVGSEGTLYGVAAVDDDWPANVATKSGAHPCGQTEKARWLSWKNDSLGHHKYEIHWTQGYCRKAPYLTWVGPLRHRVEITGWGDVAGWEYRGVTYNKDGYFNRMTAHSSVRVLTFKQCLPLPTGKWCHTTIDDWSRMVVYGLGSNHLFG